MQPETIVATASATLVQVPVVTQLFTFTGMIFWACMAVNGLAYMLINTFKGFKKPKVK